MTFVGIYLLLRNLIKKIMISLTGNCIKCLQLGAFLQSFIKLSEKNTR